MEVYLFAMPGGGEWLIIGLVVILLFGAKKIPDLARGLGRGMKEFKDAKNSVTQEIKSEQQEISNKL